ncbi:MAG: hypothetical protein GTO03_00835, partial [Planctomycetales bacterium]|nr:hypothetical protein [Planctomycetales bacterium]
PKPNFEFSPPRVLPHDDQPLQKIKPGHWVAVTQPMRANNYDFQGQTTWVPVDKSGQQLPLDRTGYQMSLSRPLALPKTQRGRKDVELVLFAPHGQQRRSRFAVELTDRSGRRHEKYREDFPLMEAHEYLMVVLARDPDRYGYLKVQNSIQPPTAGQMALTRTVYYHVLLPQIDRHVPLPTSLLTATSIAYMIWDDLDPDVLTRPQQDALLDWLHWGGQLLISGPDSLDTLAGSFLQPYLPAVGSQAIELKTEDLDQLNQRWTAPFVELRHRPLQCVRPWRAVRLELADGAAVVKLVENPVGLPLVVERRVGRGRILVSAFRLSQPDLVTSWPGFDGFLNGCLLRRPPRHFSKGEFGELEVRWSTVPGGGATPADWRDPRVITQLRLFSRDTGYRYQPQEPLSEDQAEDLGKLVGHPPGPGLGGWNDFSPVATAARQVVRAAAGIEIPSASFVLAMLLAYLTVLVPLNWATFRLIGRLEWAWIAAPLISLVSAGVVIKLAQLDIGFARAHTEIAVIEMQSDYPRTHVTRFHALYTSLSTPYTVTLEDPDAVVQPLAVDAGYVQPLGSTPIPVTFRRGAEVTLSGFRVLSNRTGLMHSEQMLSVGGPISLSLPSRDPHQVQVTNGTSYDLQRAAVVRRPAAADRTEDVLEIAWLEPVRAGQTAAGIFQPLGGTSTPPWELDPLGAGWASGSSGEGEETGLDLWPIVETALRADEFERGEVRLIALALDQPLPGVTISPAAPQKRTAAVLVAHLHYPPLPPPHRDVNTAARFQPQPRSVGGERDDNSAAEPAAPAP